jgi:ketosteroid isomerase-like protein
MSDDNVEIVRRVFDAVAARDSASVLSLYDPDVEVHFSPGTFADRMSEAGAYHGYTGLRAFDRELRSAFEDFETNCEELIDGGDRVVSVARYRARGRSSGIEVAGPPQYGVWAIETGKITRVDWFDTRDEALEAAGLSE